MKNYGKIILLSSIILLSAGFAYAASNSIKVDMAGYRATDNKYVIITTPCTSFYVRNVSDKSTVFSGSATGPIYDLTAGDNCYTADFSSLTIQGYYYIDVPGVGQSYEFNVNDTIFYGAFIKTMESYYLQRCGITVSDPDGGWGYPACHLSDADFHQSTGQSGTISATGGWHDAGDFGKYVVNGAFSAGELLLMYERYASKLSLYKLPLIPESGNSTPDVLNEIRWELGWLLKMQNPNDGGVYFKETSLQFAPFEMPNQDNSQLYIYQESSCATGDFAAVMAMAARIYAPYDAAFSQQCLAAAESAWQYLTNNPSIVPPGGFTNPPDTGTGGYGDTNDSDERLWAAAELFSTTGGAVYNNYVMSNYTNFSISEPGWPNVQMMGMLSYIFTTQTAKDTATVNAIKTNLKNFADSVVYYINSSGYKYPLVVGGFYWGSNAVSGNRALVLACEADVSGNTGYMSAAIEVAHYLLGRNPMDISYVTGIGENCVMHPHHRASASDGITAPYPGLIVGGPNSGGGDPTLQTIINEGTKPAKCYIDSQDSWASNEVAINYEAPLVFVLAAAAPDFIPTATNTIPPTPTPIPPPTPTPGPPNKNTTVYPNPVNYNKDAYMTVKFNLKEDESKVWIYIYTFAFRKIREFYWNGDFKAGWNSREINVKEYLQDLGNGTYFYTVNRERNGRIETVCDINEFMLLR